jgi:hypothetical protein
MGGELASITIVAGTVLAGVNTSESNANPSGHVAMVDLAARTFAGKCDVKVSPTPRSPAPTGASSPDNLVAVTDNDATELNRALGYGTLTLDVLGPSRFQGP